MSTTPGTAALEQVVPTAPGVDERIDWSEVEGIWGTRFPADYVAFMKTYGAGRLSRDIGILLPVPRPDAWSDGSGLRQETANARGTWEMRGGRAALDVDPESILAWGVTSGADIYCWLTTDDDPDRWPVLVCGRHTAPPFQVHPFGMAEFLHRLLTDEEFQEETISVVLPKEHSFVNWREEKRRWEAGLDPSTGDPW
ncbi:SMI1/KNR4 family protein [Streptomyces sp. ML-6]|uniref:SMI1/KNR4 family protein n=1 Tax=Streptomyces sp. ML-6 TaxID=2982693 RepID=UPI0024BF5E66|nr:SMI1/KNR4 family protein [Streptomyces sp. ML-6]MDK0524718.1 SMI1/KNR4 family protein [Streptomyces sp. ML-6]